ncbi:hypothetical protein Mal15_08890 [Stieleria maiorica]|uniref:CARDB domain-containing protein n=1 Tax=Stieleria maiorica TaxID=2795974 RepID=A0A5B9M817_9BACT|nr:hypothetical protein [Stieleria maiorica]QEF96859.1 hypothetical protein Mal15_08890 [Stieleria maiorica]
MKRPIPLCRWMFAAIAGTLLGNCLAVAHADDAELRRLLHGPDRCDHVIGLLLRHGVNNNANPAATVNAFHPYGPVAIPAAELGDLQLESIARHADTTGCGPSFDLVIKNCSTRDVCGAHVTLVGLLGRILPTSPNVTAKLDSVPAGQAIQVTLTLPIESLAMGNLNGQIIGLNRVLVVVDSYDQFMESDEANNLRSYELAALPLAAAVVTEVTESAAAVSPETTTPDPTTDASSQSAQPSSPSDIGGGFSSPDLRTAIDQFTDNAPSP